MKLELTDKATSRALEALVDSTNIRIIDAWVKDEKGIARHVYGLAASGSRYTNRGPLVREILDHVNNWMLDNGLVNIDILKNAKCSKGFNLFRIII